MMRQSRRAFRLVRALPNSIHAQAVSPACSGLPVSLRLPLVFGLFFEASVSHYAPFAEAEPPECCDVTQPATWFEVPADYSLLPEQDFIALFGLEEERS